MQQLITIEDEAEAINAGSLEVPNYTKRLKELNKIAADLQSTKEWYEVTLEALEWVLGETDVQPEIPLEEEWKLTTSSTK